MALFDLLFISFFHVSQATDLYKIYLLGRVQEKIDCPRIVKLIGNYLELNYIYRTNRSRSVVYANEVAGNS